MEGRRQFENWKCLNVSPEGQAEGDRENEAGKVLSKRNNGSRGPEARREGDTGAALTAHSAQRGAS